MFFFEQRLEPCSSIIEIGKFYFDKGDCVPHCTTPLCEIFSGYVKNLAVDHDSHPLDLKKIIVVLSKAVSLLVPSALMLKIQKVFGEMKENDIRKELVSTIIGLLKTRGLLPQNETAVFNSGKQEKKLWFIGNAAIEMGKEEPIPEVNLEKKMIFPIFYCEKHDQELNCNLIFRILWFMQEENFETGDTYA